MMERDVVMWCFFALSLLLLAATNWGLRALRPFHWRAQFTFSQAAFDQVVKVWRVSEVLQYRRWLYVDCLILLLYGAFGFLWGRQTSSLDAHSWVPREVIAGLLPLAACCDLLENVLHLRFTAAALAAGRSQPAPFLYRLSGGVSLFKFFCIAVFFVFVRF